MKKNLINVITAQDSSLLSNFINPFINQCKACSSFTTMVIGAEDFDIDSKVKTGITFEENNFNNIFEQMLEYQTKCYDLYKDNNYNANVLSRQKPILLIINGIEAFKTKLSSDNKLKISDFFTKAKDLNILNFVIVDEMDKIKKNEFETWFKAGFNPNEAIWIGDGINDQFTIKPLVRTPELKESLDDDFCFILKRGKPLLVKYVKEFKQEDNIEVI